MKVTSASLVAAAHPVGQASRGKSVAERTFAQPQESAKVALSERSQKLLAASQSGQTTTHDFTRMSPNEMKSVSLELFEAREIDLTQLRMIDLMGKPIGKMGAGGELVALTQQEREVHEGRVTNYMANIQNMIRSAREAGGGPDRLEAVRSLTELQGVLLAHQV